MGVIKVGFVLSYCTLPCRIFVKSPIFAESKPQKRSSQRRYKGHHCIKITICAKVSADILINQI